MRIGPPSLTRNGHRVLATTLVCLGFLADCVAPRCYEDLDCREGKTCSPSGACVYQCTGDGECTAGFACIEHRCRPRQDAADDATPFRCPDDMVPVANLFCVDRYEASRTDATAKTMGTDFSRAVSVKGALPWMFVDNAIAEAACAGAGKRLCTSDEWLLACQGPEGHVYAYGDTYEPTTCNGIDALGGGAFQVAPTGSFASCTNGWGVFDMNGNVWEHVAGGDDTRVRGGAFNCMDSAALHKCGYIPGNWSPSALGFRCCLTPTGSPAGDSNADAGCCEDATP